MVAFALTRRAATPPTRSPEWIAKERACAGGSADACVEVATWYQSGRNPASRARAADLLGRACDLGLARGCAELAEVLVDAEARDDARIVALYQRACDGGDAIGCNNLAAQYQRGIGVARDPARALALYRRACDGGAPAGCVNLGTFYEDGAGVARDEAKAAALYRGACDRGSRMGCNNLGLLYHDGHGVPRDPARAADLFRRACDDGELPACINLGDLYERGAGVARDGDQAVALYRRACAGESSKGCAALQRLGVAPPEPALVERALERDCRARDWAVCNRLGVELTARDPPDYARAQALFAVACDNADAEACFHLGVLHLRGDGVVHDEARGRDLVDRACRGHFTEACRFLGRAP